jgi:hypothetical protein
MRRPRRLISFGPHSLAIGSGVCPVAVCETPALAPLADA